MTFLATLRQLQRTRARTVLALLVVVWLNLTLQACASSAPPTDMPADRTVASSTLDPSGAHSGDAHGEHCPFCPGREHDGCAEQGSCDGPVAAGTKAEVRLPESLEFESTAAVTVSDPDLAVINLDTSPVRPSDRAVAAAVPLNIQHCVYLI